MLMRWMLFSLVVTASALLPLLLLPIHQVPLTFLLISAGGVTVALLARLYRQRVSLNRMLDWLSRARQARWGQIILLLGGVMALYVGAAQLSGAPLDAPYVTSALSMLGVGAGMVFFAAHGLSVPLAPVLKIAQPEGVQPFGIRWRWMALSLALISFTAWRGAHEPPVVFVGEQLLTWALGLIAFIQAIKPVPFGSRQPDFQPLAGWEWWLVAALLIGALLMRTVNLETVPYLFDQDEAMFPDEGVSWLQRDFLTSPFAPGILSWVRLYQILIGFAVGLFGPTVAAARLWAAMFSALTVVFLYLLGRELGGWRLGLASALFMLTWSFHVQFGRLALNQPGDPLFAVIAFYLLLRGLRRGATVDFALSGMALGMTQIFYIGGRAIPFIMLGLIVWLWLRERPIIAQQWRQLLMLPTAAFVILIPHHYYLLANREPLTTRAITNIFVSGQFEGVVASGEDVFAYLVGQVRNSFLATIWFGDVAGWYDYGGGSLVGVVGTPFFLLGLAVLGVLMWRHPKWALPIGWMFAVIFLGSTLSHSPPHFQRYLIGDSAFALTVGVGVMFVAHSLAAHLQQPKAYDVLLIGIALLVCLGNFWYYVAVYMPTSNALANPPNQVTNALAREMVRAHEEGRQVLLIESFATGAENSLVVRYLMSDKRYSLYDRDGISQLESGKPLAIFAGVTRLDELRQLMVIYPNGRLRTVHLSEDGAAAFYVYEYP
ncbi:MAG: glycosyltransferase family 39 protein [Aggregatilineales bacterium]